MKKLPVSYNDRCSCSLTPSPPIYLKFCCIHLQIIVPQYTSHSQKTWSGFWTGRWHWMHHWTLRQLRCIQICTTSLQRQLLPIEMAFISRSLDCMLRLLFYPDTLPHGQYWVEWVLLWLQFLTINAVSIILPLHAHQLWQALHKVAHYWNYQFEILYFDVEFRKIA